MEYKYYTNKICARTFCRTKEVIKLIEKNEPNLYSMPIQKITREHLKIFFRSITKYSNSTIDKLYQLIRKAFRKALVRKLILEDPFLDEDDMFKPKSTRPSKFIEALTVSEQKRLIDILSTYERDSFYKNIILLQMYTGMRIGEVLAINRLCDISFENKTLAVTKTLTRDLNNHLIISNKTKTFDKNKNANRMVKITPTISKILKSQLKTMNNVENLLFYDDGIVSPLKVNGYLYKINRRYNICNHLSTHVFRHTYATRCIESGMSSKVLQRKLGHANITTTLDTYASVFAKFEDNEDDKYNRYIRKEGLIINL